MQKNNPLYFNNYTVLFNALRLTLLISFLNLCVVLSSCQKSADLQVFAPQFEENISPNAVNINEASEKELEKLPGIGEELARRIVAHRQNYGRFKRPADLIIVRGMSDQKFRRIKNLVKVE